MRFKKANLSEPLVFIVEMIFFHAVSVKLFKLNLNVHILNKLRASEKKLRKTRPKKEMT